MSDDVECPYCEEGQEICHDDGYGYEEEQTYEQQCGHCEKTFVFTTSISFYYESEKADCLNNGEHQFKPTCTAPIKYTTMRCEACSQERQPTKKELYDHIKEVGERHKCTCGATDEVHKVGCTKHYYLSELAKLESNDKLKGEE